MDVIASGRLLLPGDAVGLVLRCEPSISLWGGVDAVSSAIIAPDHPLRGATLAGRILVTTRSIGSSSGSSVLLELAANGRAPAAIILGERDAIVTLGALVAVEMGYGAIPVLLVDPKYLHALEGTVRLDCQGRVLRES